MIFDLLILATKFTVYVNDSQILTRLDVSVILVVNAKMNF